MLEWQRHLIMTVWSLMDSFCEMGRESPVFIGEWLPFYLHLFEIELKHLIHLLWAEDLLRLRLEGKMAGLLRTKLDLMISFMNNR